MATASRPLVTALALLLAAGCAAGGTLDDDAGGNGGGDDDIDSGVVIIPDAAEGTPDAADGLPDAAVGSPDAAGPATGCALYQQTGCGLGEACDLDEANLATGGTICRAVTVQGGSTSTCTGTTTCSAGFVCLGAAGESHCAEYCQNDMVCDGTGGLCVIGLVYGDPAMPVNLGGAQVKVCSNNCNPLDGTGCPTGFGCHVGRSAEAAPRNFTLCDKAGAGTQEGACTTSGDCASGFTCVNANGNKCLKYCDKPGTAGTLGGCAAGQTCYQLTVGNPAANATIGAKNYGVCWDGT
jgi:hypothetical protein